MRSLDGTKMLWVWEYQKIGGPEENVALAQRTGCNALCFKHDDNGFPYLLGQDPALPHYREACKRNGIAFGLWGYHYGRRLTAEASMIGRAGQVGADFYVIDWEAQFQRNISDLFDPNRQLYDYLVAVKTGQAAYPDMGVFHSPLAWPQYHYPWMHQAFQSALDGMLPQIYHQARGVEIPYAFQDAYDAYAEYGLTEKPIWPALQAYNVPAEDITAAAYTATRTYGAKGLSWWSAQELNEQTEQAIAGVNLEVPMRRVNGLHPDYPTSKRAVLTIGSYTIPVREKLGLLTSDQRAVLDLEFAPVPNQPAPVILVLDDSGAFAGYVDATGWRRSIPVYLGATGSIKLVVKNASTRVVLFGILEAGG